MAQSGVEAAKREEEARNCACEAWKSLAFPEFFNQASFPDVEITKKPVTVRKEREHVKNWIGQPQRAFPKEMFLEMTPGLGNPLVFPDRKGGVMQQIPSSFKRAVEDLGLNTDISDPKKRFSFHGLRRTNASWMVQAGVDLFRVQKRLGHSSPVVTQRY